MSVSSNLGKDMTKDWFKEQLLIKSIVDVGAGSGTYRKLLGENYDWTAIEAWQKNIINFKLDEIYNKVIFGDIREIELPKADCIIFGDIIEHMPKSDGIIVLERAKKQYSHLVLSIPIGVYKQEQIEENPYEEHLSTWYLPEIIHILSPSEYKLVLYHESCPPNLGIGVFFV